MHPPDAAGPQQVIGTAIEAHRAAGLIESVHEFCLLEDPSDRRCAMKKDHIRGEANVVPCPVGASL